MNDLIWASIVSFIFLSLFTISAILRKRGVKVEVTRKFVHFGGAFVTIFFPFILKSHWTVFALSISFALLMFLTQKSGLLQSVHGVTRKSDGVIYHPIAIYLCFLYSQFLGQPWFYVISILILAISDALAALVGKNYGAYEYLVETEIRKTVEGSVTFFLTSFLIVHLILLLCAGIEGPESVCIALLISIIVTIFEGVSLKGADNLFIPLGTMFILSKNLHPTADGVLFQIAVLISFLMFYLIFMLPYKRIGFSGVVLLGLINYIVWALLGNICAAILLVSSFICGKTNLILDYDCPCADLYRVRPIFYILTVPVVCSFLGNFIGALIIYPFLASIVCEGVIIKNKLFDGDLNKGLWLTSLLSLLALGAGYVFVG